MGERDTRPLASKRVIPAPVPMFSWVSLHNTPSGEALSFLVINPELAIPHAEALGARAWRALETLVWHARSSPDYEFAYVYYGSLEDLLTQAQGADPAGGWGRDAIRPFILTLEKAGYFTRHPGKGKGRSRGSTKTTWVMSTKLYTQAPIFRLPNHTLADDWTTYSYASGPSASLPHKTSGLSASATSAAPHEDDMRNVHNHGTQTTNAVRDRVRQTLQSWGWVTDIDAAIAKHSDKWLALWIIDIQRNSKIDDPGAFLRSRSKSDVPPPLWDSEVIPVVKNGELTLSTSADEELADLPKVGELLAHLSLMPENLADEIRARARSYKPEAGEAPGIAWRKAVWSEIRTHMDEGQESRS